jgi:hypothetical protein
MKQVTQTDGVSEQRAEEKFGSKKYVITGRWRN